MKILMVNKFHYIKGGSETYYFALKRLLTENGHEVIDFSMQDDRNFDSPYAEYFVPNVDYAAMSGVGAKIKSAANIVYSRDAKRRFEALVRQTRPDVVHLHIFQHQISPSILDVIKKYDIPTVYTAHDLKMLCLNYKMMAHGQLCERCKGGKYYECLKHKCVKDSYAKSAVNVVEGYLHKWRHSYDAIDVVLTPSRFYLDKFLSFGIRQGRVHHLPNFLGTRSAVATVLPGAGQYYLYFGRLSEEKGILTLLRAVEGTGLPLYIVGTGPLEEEVRAYVREHGMDTVTLWGYRSGQELTDLVGNAKAVVLPSEWYENGPYSAIEALQLGRPILGAAIGGIPELVRDNGLLFESGNAADLREKLLAFEQTDADAYNAYCRASAALFDEVYSAEAHYPQLMRYYEQAMRAHEVH